MDLSGRHKHKVEQRAPFCRAEGAERQGEGGRPVWSTTIMLGVVYQTVYSKVKQTSAGGFSCRVRSALLKMRRRRTLLTHTTAKKKKNYFENVRSSNIWQHKKFILKNDKKTFTLLEISNGIKNVVLTKLHTS